LAGAENLNRRLTILATNGARFVRRPFFLGEESTGGLGYKKIPLPIHCRLSLADLEVRHFLIEVISRVMAKNAKELCFNARVP
jgi:hypothetical protein